MFDYTVLCTLEVTYVVRRIVNLTKTCCPAYDEADRNMLGAKKTSHVKHCFIGRLAFPDKTVFRLQWTIGHSNIKVTDLLNCLKVTIYLNHCFSSAKIYPC